MRYLILDLDKIDTTDAKSDSALFRLELKGIALSEEETLAKFKEVWGKAIKSAMDASFVGGFHNGFIDIDWDEFKKEL